MSYLPAVGECDHVEGQEINSHNIYSTSSDPAQSSFRLHVMNGVAVRDVPHLDLHRMRLRRCITLSDYSHITFSKANRAVKLCEGGGPLPEYVGEGGARMVRHGWRSRM